MPSLKLYDMNAKEVGAIELSDLFDMEYNEPLIHQAVVTRLANERQGTKSTLTRSEVRGGGAKPWRQKGTGRARQGSIRSPQWVKGGVVFAPKSRDFSKKMNVMARRIAIFSALSQKVRDGEMIVTDQIAVAAPKTKEMVKFLNAFKLDKTVLVVMSNADENVRRASANLAKVTTIPVEQINTYDVVKNAKIVISKDAVLALEDVYGADEEEVAKAEPEAIEEAPVAPEKPKKATKKAAAEPAAEPAAEEAPVKKTTRKKTAKAEEAPAAEKSEEVAE